MNTQQMAEEIDRLARLCEAKDADIVKFRSAYEKQYRATDKLLEDNDRLEAPIAMQAEALKNGVDELKEFAQEVGGCDHSVGICMCETFRRIADMENALSATSETVAAWRAKETEPLRMEVARLIAALRKIVDEGDYTAPEGMTRVAKEALNDTKATALAYEREVKAKALEEALSRMGEESWTVVQEMIAELRASKGEVK